MINIFKTSLAYIISISIVFQSIAPSFASHINSIEQAEKEIAFISKYKSVPSTLTFKSTPGKTSASILYYAQHEGETYILLGDRDDGDGLCNFGGGSSEESQNPKALVDLSWTAEREAREESNKNYVTHRRLLKNKEFIDVLRKNGDSYELHRMFWKEVQYLSAEVLQDSLAAATADEEREFNYLKWYKASVVFNASVQGSPQLSESEVIFSSLFDTLRTDSGLCFLSQLTSHKKIHPFARETRKLKNRLYLISPLAQESDNEDDMQVDDGQPVEKPVLQHYEPKGSKWQVAAGNLDAGIEDPRENETIQEESRRKAPLRQKIKNLTKAHQHVMWGQNAIGQQTVPAAVAKSQFAQAVGAFAAMLVELQENTKFLKHSDITPSLPMEKFQEPTGPINPDAANLWDPNLGASITDIHLRMVLGPDYQESSALGDQRKADLANLKTYLERYTQVEEEQKNNPEFKRDILSVENNDYENFADDLAYHRKISWPTFVHAADEGLHSLWNTFTYLRRLKTLSPLKDIIVLRGNDSYFSSHSDIAEVNKDLGPDDDKEDVRNQVLCLNAAETAGLATTRTTSSSIEYEINNHSVNEQNTDERYNETMLYSGFQSPDYSYFHSIFKQFLAHLGGHFGNSVMLSISVHPSFLGKYSYAAYGGGIPYEVSVCDDDTENDSEETNNNNKNSSSSSSAIQQVIPPYTSTADNYQPVLSTQTDNFSSDSSHPAAQNAQGFNQAAKDTSIFDMTEYMHDDDYFDCLMGGAQWDVDISNVITATPELKSSSTLFILYNIQEEYRRQISLGYKEPFETYNQFKINLNPEFRLHIHPSLVLKNDRIKFRMRPRFNMQPEQKQLFHKEMLMTTGAVIGDWLEQESMVFPHIYQGYPKVKTLYNIIHEGISGQKVKESQALSTLKLFFEQNNVPAIKAILRQGSPILDQFSSLKDKRDLVLASINSSNIDTINIVIEALGVPFNQLFPEGGKELYMFLRKMSFLGYDGLEEIKDFDPFSNSFLDLSLKENIINILEGRKVIGNRTRSSSFEDCFSERLRPTQELKKQFLKHRLLSNEDIDSLNSTDSDYLFELGFKTISTEGQLNSGIDRININSYISGGLDPFKVFPSSKNPAIFDFFACGNFFDDTIEQILKIRDVFNKLRTTKNHEGFTLLQYCQKLFMDKKIDGRWYYFFKELYGSNIELFQSDSYEPFLKYFGFNGQEYISYDYRVKWPKSSNFHYKHVNPMLFAANSTWADRLQNIKTIDDYNRIIQGAPSAAILKLMRIKLEEFNPAAVFVATFYQQQKYVQQWNIQINQALSSNNQEEYQRLLSCSPRAETEYEACNPNLFAEAKLWRAENFQIWNAKSKSVKASGIIADIKNHIFNCPVVDARLYNYFCLPTIFDYQPHLECLTMLERLWPVSIIYTLPTDPVDLTLLQSLLEKAPNFGAKQKLLYCLLYPGDPEDFISRPNGAAANKYRGYLPCYLQHMFPDKKAYSQMFGLIDSPFNKDDPEYQNIDIWGAQQNYPELILHAGPWVRDILKAKSKIKMPHITEEQLKELITYYPDIFDDKDELRNFFYDFLAYSPNVRRMLCLSYPNKLKECSPITGGLPTFLAVSLHIAFDVINEDYDKDDVYEKERYVYHKKGLQAYFETLREVIAKDPSLLDVKSVEGISALELINLFECKEHNFSILPKGVKSNT